MPTKPAGGSRWLRFSAATSALTAWSSHRYSSAQLMPSAIEFEPASARMEAALAADPRAVFPARPEPAPADQPTEADVSQQGYATHGG